MRESRPHNMGLFQAGNVQTWSFVLYSSSVQVDSFVLQNLSELKTLIR